MFVFHSGLERTLKIGCFFYILKKSADFLQEN